MSSLGLSVLSGRYGLRIRFVLLLGFDGTLLASFSRCSSSPMVLLEIMRLILYLELDRLLWPIRCGELVSLYSSAAYYSSFIYFCCLSWLRLG
jgi:hypothetical protein